ncbi:dienelactone hydrolase family protein [Plantactinospora sp. GCM10030261]|uniref:dienelactone hydrolase family protein n=1 Tax=Plantactinospora sp. GCM10030261 TaxID=3273420 RepID=UPI00361BF318
MGEMVTYHGAGNAGEGYLARPAPGESRPAVVVVQEWWGLVPHITSVADRFAEAGFAALAVDLDRGASAGLDRSGQETRPVDAPELDRASVEIAGAAEYLAGRSGVAGKVGVVGFGAGGSLALWSATRSDRIVGAVGFYPVLPWDGMPTDWAGYAGKSALIHCCAEEPSSGDGALATRRAIETAGGECQVCDYPGTVRAFFDDDRPEAYHQPAAASAWARTLEFFRAKLG